MESCFLLQISINSWLDNVPAFGLSLLQKGIKVLCFLSQIFILGLKNILVKRTGIELASTGTQTFLVEKHCVFLLWVKTLDSAVLIASIVDLNIFHYVSPLFDHRYNGFAKVEDYLAS